VECKIREWQIEDAENLALVINNKKIQDNLRDGIPYPYTVENAKEYITSMLSADKDETYAFAITVDDKAIGSIGVFRCNNIHFRSAEMGYYIAESYWGKGIGVQWNRPAGIFLKIRILSGYLQNPLLIIRHLAIFLKRPVFNVKVS